MMQAFWLMKKPKIVVCDIETIPNLLEALKVWPQLSDYPGRTLKADITSMVCFGYKVIDKMKKAKTISLWDYPTNWKKNINDDYPLVKAIYDVLINADILVTHNGKRFDIPYINTRIMYHMRNKKNHGLTQIPNIPHIDTCKTAKNHLFLFNNRLNTLGKFLNLGEKDDTGGWDLWVDVYHRNKKAMIKMAKYCAQDVNLTSEVFSVLKSVSKDMPNMGMFNNSRPSCSKCGSVHVISRGPRVTKTKIVQTYQCNDCGSWMQQAKRNFKSL